MDEAFGNLGSDNLYGTDADDMIFGDFEDTDVTVVES